MCPPVARYFPIFEAGSGRHAVAGIGIVHSQYLKSIGPTKKHIWCATDLSLLIAEVFDDGFKRL